MLRYDQCLFAFLGSMIRRTALYGFPAIVLAAGLSCFNAASADPVSKNFDPKLYAPRPPSGSSYVRVVDGGTTAANVAIGSEAPVLLTTTGMIATTYRVVQGHKNFTITINGRAASPMTVAPDKYLTLIYRPSSSGPKLTAITDDPGEDNGLLAQLRFYNLVSGCTASLTLQNGPTVFEGVAKDESKSRSINPVTATLVPKCETAVGAPLKLPPLKAGDHYSIFLVGSAAKPGAVGNTDITEAYKG